MSCSSAARSRHLDSASSKFKEAEIRSAAFRVSERWVSRETQFPVMDSRSSSSLSSNGPGGGRSSAILDWGFPVQPSAVSYPPQAAGNMRVIPGQRSLGCIISQRFFFGSQNHAFRESFKNCRNLHTETGQSSSRCKPCPSPELGSSLSGSNFRQKTVTSAFASIFRTQGLMSVKPPKTSGSVEKSPCTSLARGKGSGFGFNALLIFSATSVVLARSINAWRAGRSGFSTQSSFKAETISFPVFKSSSS